MVDSVAGEWDLVWNSCSLYYAEWDEKEEGNEAVQQWEDDWDDDDVNDDFSLQLRKELEGSNAQKSWSIISPVYKWSFYASYFWKSEPLCDLCCWEQSNSGVRK